MLKEVFGSFPANPNYASACNPTNKLSSPDKSKTQ
jgi:hypothetical protein